MQVMPPDSESSAPAASAKPRVFCKGCGYALEGLLSSKCPECGRAFDLAHRGTFARRPPRGALWRWGWRIATLIVALAGAWGLAIGWLWWEWDGEQPTFQKLRSVHALIVRKQIGPPQLDRLLGKERAYLRNRVVRVDLEDVSRASLESIDLGSLHHLEKLRFWHCGLDDAILGRVGSLTTLRDLVILTIKTDKPNLAFLEKLNHLTRLKLMERGIDDAGLAHVQKLSELEDLELLATSVTDAGLEYLSGLASLKRLQIHDTRITDAGLDHLKNMKSLTELAIGQTRITAGGLERLKQALPGLKINWADAPIHPVAPRSQ